MTIMPSQPDAAVRTILVTGGTSGLGRVIATGFAAAGHRVMICSRSSEDCERVAAEISAATDGTCIGHAADIANHAAADELAAHVADEFGLLHTLVNNAGAVAPGPLEAVDEAGWDRVLDVNLKAAFFLTQKLASSLRKAATPQWPASVINIGSYAGGRVGPQPHYPYSAAKAGLRLLTQALARGLASDHVTVNSIALGVFPQDSAILRGYGDDVLDAVRQSIPAGRFGEAEDIVGLTQFLASRAAAYITGASIPLDGGMHI